MELVILTHCYPRGPTDNSGIWIKNLWDHRSNKQIQLFSGRNPFSWFRTVIRLRRDKSLVIAYWMFPAGILAWLSGAPYIVNCIGLDVFMASRSRLLKWLLYPMLVKAKKLVFIGRHPMEVFNKTYGDRFVAKSRLIYFIVGKEFYKAANDYLLRSRT